MQAVTARIFRLAVTVWLIACPVSVRAVQPGEVMADPAQEARARALSRDLRCMVCQNQSIDDSDAELARDLRLLVRERIAGGDTNAQVIDFLVARYGEFVLLKPRFEKETFLLWMLPPLVLVGGAMALWMHGRRKAFVVSEINHDSERLSAAEETRLEQLITTEEAGDKLD